MPDFIRYYLGEEPLIANVPTYRCLYEDERTFVLDNLRELVLKPANESGGYGIVIGNRATDAQLAPRSPRRSGPIRATGSPSRSSSCRRPRRSATTASSRATSTSGRSSSPANTSYVTAGGLTRVALPKDSLIVNSSQGGGSKDTWIVDGRRRRPRPAGRPRNGGDVLLSRVADDIYWAARYLERAEDTARMVRAHAETVADLPGDVRRTHWKPLITVVGSDAQYDERFGGDGSRGRGRRSTSFPTSSTRAASSDASVRRARTCAPRAKRSRRGLAGGQRPAPVRQRRGRSWRRSSGARPVPRRVVERQPRIDGILATTMSHDEAYAMWRLGRAFERADMTTRVLGVAPRPC